MWFEDRARRTRHRRLGADPDTVAATVLPSRWKIVACGWLVALGVARVGFASDATTLAKERSVEGALALEKHDFEGARLAFLQALAIDAQPRYLWSLAVAEDKGAHPLEALAHFRQYLQRPGVTEEDRHNAAPLMADASARVGHIRVDAASAATVVLDGATPVGTVPPANVVDVAPGHHTLHARLGVQSASTDIDAHPGETVVWQLQFEPAKQAPAAPTPIAAGPPSAAPSSDLDRALAFLTPNGKPLPSEKWVVSASLVAAGLVSFGIVGAFSVAASNQDNKWTDLSAQTGVCPQPPMTSACMSLKNAADARATDQNVAVGFIVGGATLVTAGIVALIAWPNPHPSSGMVTPMLTPGGGGAQWVGRF